MPMIEQSKVLKETNVLKENLHSMGMPAFVIDMTYY